MSRLCRLRLFRLFGFAEKLHEREASGAMKISITYWKEADGRYLGFLNSHPDHWTQGDDLADLRVHLRDLYELFSAEDVPGIRKVEELEVV